MKYRFEQADAVHEIDVQPTEGGYVVRGKGGEPQSIQLRTRSDGSQLAITPWGEFILSSARRGAEVWAELGGRRLSARVERARPSALGTGNGASLGAVRAPMAGKLLRVSVAVGDVVTASQPVAVIEAMKMENELLAPIAGVVTEALATAPSTVEKGALVVRVEPR
ncbi:MAG: Methylcrotonyl-CoA carboxylase biotin-containing subunit [Polyangiaceae bacterium]|jgi:biotin carboxyl carrier protein|nr:Methylcrotonyl-CoA carboxylase biotin-containing subunit [Polyangiaceae bacterium]